MEQNSITRILATLYFTLFTICSWAQSAALSENGDVAVFSNITFNKSLKSAANLNIQVVERSTGNQLGVISQRLNLGNILIDVAVDNAGRVLKVLTNESVVLWSVTQSKVLFTADVNSVVGFSDGAPLVYLGDCCSVKAIDVYSGKVVQTFQVGNNKEVVGIYSTINDDLLGVQTNSNELFFYHSTNARPVKKLKATTSKYSKQTNVITNIVQSGEAGSSYVYQLPSFNRLSKINVATALREYIKQLNDRARMQGSRNYQLLGKVLMQNIYVNELANTLFVPAVSNKKYYCYVIDLISEKVLFRFEMDDDTFLTEEVNNQIWFRTKKTRYQLDPKNRGWNVTTTSTSKITSLGFENKSNAVTFYGLNNTNMQQSVIGCKALMVHKKHHLALVVSGTKKGQVDLGKNNLKVSWFGLNKPSYSEKLLTESKQSGTGKITGFKHISEAKAEDSLKVIFKTIEGGNRTGVEVLIQDKNGFIYQGASAPEWKHIWCKLSVKQPDGSVEVKESFEVTEYMPQAGIPMAIAIAGDYSGSMGKQRARQLTKGMMSLVNSKRPEDYMSIIKYDHRVLASPLRTNKQELLTDATAVNFEQLNGGTAMLDAINAAIQAIKFLPNVEQRAVIVLTDGNDISSRIPLSKVIVNARLNKVKIYTIAYGDEVEYETLKNIAHRTQGGFYTVANAKDFEWIYQDIYNRASTYYNVGFSTTQKGVQVHQLKVCPPAGKSDSIEVKFNNDLDDLLVTKTARNPVEKVGEKPTFKTNNLVVPQVNIQKPIVIKTPKIEEDVKTMAEEAFDQIALPKFNFLFDKVEIVKDTEARIKQVIQFLESNPNANLVIIGHTDNLGSEAYNQILSENRAKEVAALIFKYGGSLNRLTIAGYGETSPIADNLTEVGRDMNRRVEFRVEWSK